MKRIMLFPLIFSVFCFNSSAQNLQSGFESVVNSSFVSLKEGSCRVDLPVPAMTAVSGELNKGEAPVIITVAGLGFGEIGWGPFEIKNLKKIISIFFPKKSAGKEFDKAFYSAYKDYMAEDILGPLKPSEPSQGNRTPDDYLEVRIKELPNFNSNSPVIPFNWSRDPADSDKTIPVFMEKMREVWKEYGGKKPIYVVAHSWGSVLMYNAFERLSAGNPEIKVDKFVTLGSPLIPGNVVLKAFMAVEIKKEDLEKRVIHPADVKLWKNFWADRDLYSNAILSADYNKQVDEGVDKLEPVLLDLVLHNKILRPLAEKDFLVFRSLRTWHYSYIYDYQAYLESVDKEIDVRVFSPLIAPQLSDCDK